jgi:cytochrome c peroxidase
MKIKFFAIFATLFGLIVMGAFRNDDDSNVYKSTYSYFLNAFENSSERMQQYAGSANVNEDSLRTLIHQVRMDLKPLDFWFRYANPIQYKLINGPLPVEWETEVFEKYEKPYKRIGSGLTLAEIALNDNDSQNVLKYIGSINTALNHFKPDSMIELFKTADHFAFCNRLYILNLSTLYTTSFECPDQDQIIPELLSMLKGVRTIYTAYTNTYTQNPLSVEYLDKYDACIRWVENQPMNPQLFDHFTFISQYVNQLYRLQANWILKNDFRSKSMLDYTINKEAQSIFDKIIYRGQNTKGVFIRVNNTNDLNKIEQLGRLLFNEPLLSGNIQRSCVSCHIPEQGFTDTTQATALAFNYKGKLRRNAPSLLNSEYNHLIMQDGKHLTLQEQALSVITNPEEMNCPESLIMKRVLSCKTYKVILSDLSKLTPQAPEPSIAHIVSALTYYYSKFSASRSSFDDAMELKSDLPREAKRGFNLFMSKAQCATCHFLPIFNGVKPPFVGSEFEVLGVPDDTVFTKFGADSGRYLINPSFETLYAFRTGTLKNINRTSPYMHNGIYKTLREVVVFYNEGGGNGRGLNLSNQTLSSDKLELTEREISEILVFLGTLNENYTLDKQPIQLPKSKNKQFNKRVIGGIY